MWKVKCKRLNQLLQKHRTVKEKEKKKKWQKAFRTYRKKLSEENPLLREKGEQRKKLREQQRLKQSDSRS